MNSNLIILKSVLNSHPITGYINKSNFAKNEIVSNSASIVQTVLYMFWHRHAQISLFSFYSVSVF